MTAVEDIVTSTYAVCGAVATVTPKAPADSQDRARTVLAPDGAAAVLCDGVGSYADSGVVAERCVRLACGHIGIEGVGVGVVSCADAAARLMAGEVDLPEGATTLVAVGAGTSGHAYFSLVGNGAVFAFEPLSLRGGRAELMAAELVTPHSEMRGSQAALRSFLPAPRMPVEDSSGVLLPRHGHARLLLACSDGITTVEEREYGRVASTDVVWGRLDAPFVAVRTALEGIWGELRVATDAGDVLTSTLEQCLGELRERDLLDDDATVAAVFVQPEGTEEDAGGEPA